MSIIEMNEFRWSFRSDSDELLLEVGVVTVLVGGVRVEMIGQQVDSGEWIRSVV